MGLKTCRLIFFVAKLWHDLCNSKVCAFQFGKLLAIANFVPKHFLFPENESRSLFKFLSMQAPCHSKLKSYLFKTLSLLCELHSDAEASLNSDVHSNAE